MHHCDYCGEPCAPDTWPRHPLCAVYSAEHALDQAIYAAREWRHEAVEDWLASDEYKAIVQAEERLQEAKELLP